MKGNFLTAIFHIKFGSISQHNSKPTVVTKTIIRKKKGTYAPVAVKSAVLIILNIQNH